MINYTGEAITAIGININCDDKVIQSTYCICAIASYIYSQYSYFGIKLCGIKIK